MWRPEIDEEFEREINYYCSATFRSEKSMSLAHCHQHFIRFTKEGDDYSRKIDEGQTERGKEVKNRRMNEKR